MTDVVMNALIALVIVAAIPLALVPAIRIWALVLEQWRADRKASRSARDSG